MPRGGVFDVSFLILSSLAVVFALVAYVKDPSLPLLGARNGLALLWFIIPRLVPGIRLSARSGCCGRLDTGDKPRYDMARKSHRPQRTPA